MFDILAASGKRRGKIGGMRLRSLLVLTGLLTLNACGTPSSTPVPPPATAVTAGTDVWAAYRRAAGGDALTRIRTIRATGFAVDPTEKGNRRLVIEAGAPARYRQRETPTSARGSNIRTLVGFDGTTGWWAGNTILGGEAMSEDAALRQRAITAAGQQAYINVMSGLMPLWLQDAGLTFTTIGTIPDGEDRGDTAVTIAADGTAVGRLVLDADTHLPRRIVVPYLRSIRPEGGEYTMSFDEYRDVGDGVLLPHRISRTKSAVSKLLINWVIRSYQINPELPATTFDPPKRR
jgi:hypothetical protein